MPGSVVEAFIESRIHDSLSGVTAYAGGVDVTTVQEAFLPSKLADAMERYGPGVADKPEPSHDRYSTVSEANTSEDHFFSEGESIASSVTSVDGFELREDKTKEVLDKVEGATVSGVSNVLRREDEEPVDDSKFLAARSVIWWLMSAFST